MTMNDPKDDPQYQVGGQAYKSPYERGDDSTWDAKTVLKIHGKSDVDSSQTAHHHTLGPRHDQSSPGDHKHNGIDSLRILAGTTITGSRGGNAAVASIILALVKLGATDNTIA